MSYIWLIKGMAIAAVVVAACLWAHGRGYDEGDKDARKVLEPLVHKASRERDAALNANEALAKSAAACSREVEELHAATIARNAQAAAAIAKAKAEASRHEADARWLADLRLREQDDQSCDAGLKIVRERLAQ